MNNAFEPRRAKSLVSFGVSALLAVGAATAQVALAMTPSTGLIDDSGDYRQEVQACMSGQTQQARDTCLLEARNAQADKKRGVLNQGGDFAANAMARCNVFTTGEDHAACEARVMGMGSIEGTVDSGGLLREAETVVLPAGEHSVTVVPQTDKPVVLVPSTSTLGNR
jgi:hypothetical protein